MYLFIIKSIHTLEIDCCLTCNNQFCYYSKESRKTIEYGFIGPPCILCIDCAINDDDETRWRRSINLRIIFVAISRRFEKSPKPRGYLLPHSIDRKRLQQLTNNSVNTVYTWNRRCQRETVHLTYHRPIRRLFNTHDCDPPTSTNCSRTRYTSLQCAKFNCNNVYIVPITIYKFQRILPPKCHSLLDKNADFVKNFVQNPGFCQFLLLAYDYRMTFILIFSQNFRVI